MNDKESRAAREARELQAAQQQAQEDRTPREQETRAAEESPRPWRPASLLPDPRMDIGFVYRWVRTSAGGLADTLNVAKAFREGWVPVRAKDHPELYVASDQGSRFPENVEVGGLLLCKNTTANMRARRDHYRGLTKRQMDAIQTQLMAEQDPRLQTMYHNVRSVTQFGPEVRRDRATVLPTTI